MKNKINISNYEAFLLDFIEGNLSDNEIVLLKDFVLAHPELEIDLTDSELVTIEKDSLIFSEKNAIKKTDKDLVSEEKFIAYIENTLNHTEKKQIEDACALNTDLSKELKLYKATILKADAAVIFKDKKTLKKETKIISFYKPVYYSIAAALLLVLGIWFLLKDKTVSTTINSNTLSGNLPVKTNTASVAVNKNSVNKNAKEIKETTNQNKSEYINNKSNYIKEEEHNLTNNVQNQTKLNFLKDSVNFTKEEQVVIAKDSSLKSDIIVQTPPKTNKSNYIIIQEEDNDDLAENNLKKEKKGFWNKAQKALNNLNKMGVKQVNGLEIEETNNEQYVLSLGSLSIQNKRYN